MSLLTIQPVFNSTDDYLLKKFNKTQLSFEYNLVCVSCASLGILGAIYQVNVRFYIDMLNFRNKKYQASNYNKINVNNKI